MLFSKKIPCSKLIQKFREKAKECEEYKQQLKEVQTKLSVEEKGRMGLLAELNILHHVSRLRVCVVGEKVGLVVCESVRNSACMNRLYKAIESQFSLSQ